MSVRRFKQKWDCRVEWGNGPDAQRNEPDNSNNSRPVHRKITIKFMLIIERRKIYQKIYSLYGFARKNRCLQCAFANAVSPLLVR